MNKIFLQRVFNSKSGWVYTYSGDSSIVEITEKFVAAAGNNLLDTMVVKLPQFGTTVVYTNAEVVINSPEFELFTDLTPDPEVVVEPAPAAPEQGI